MLLYIARTSAQPTAMLEMGSISSPSRFIKSVGKTGSGKLLDTSSDAHVLSALLNRKLVLTISVVHNTTI